MHPSIIEAGTWLKCSTASPFGCPLCLKFTTKSESVIQRHLLNHKANAVHFNGKIICRCNLPCRDKGHFHCPFCETTIIRKDTILPHVTECQNKCDMTQLTSIPPSEPPSPETHLTVLSSISLAHSYSLPPYVSSASAVKKDHTYPLTGSPKSPALATDLEEEHKAPEEQSLPQPAAAITSRSRVDCPHCSVVVVKRNLVTHIQRKHGPAKDITAQSHLQCACVDQRNGLYAVRKTYRGFSVPVHVQRKTWGAEQMTRCEVEDCQQYLLPPKERGLSHSLCRHIRSVDYCHGHTREEHLDHKVLQEMVENHFVSDSNGAVCKTRQREAEEARVPFSVLVDFPGCENYISLSIHEPTLHKYSTLGRVFVTRHIEKSTWHCPCAKAQASCTHKHIAMWHLYQTHKHLFKTVPPTTTSATTTHCQSDYCRDGEKCDGCLRVQEVPNHSPLKK